MRYGDALVDAGHGPDEERIGVMLHTFVGADRDSAVATARGPMTAYMRSSMTLFGLDAAQRAGEPVSEEAVEELLAHRYAEYAANRCLIGSVDSCVPLVAALADLGVDEIACLIDFGVGTDEVLASLAHLDRLRERCADL